jgi:hypothetical protein
MPATDTTRPAERLLGDLDAALAEVCRLAEELPRQTDQIRQLFLDGNGDVLRLRPARRSDPWQRVPGARAQ